MFPGRATAHDAHNSASIVPAVVAAVRIMFNGDNSRAGNLYMVRLMGHDGVTLQIENELKQNQPVG